MPPTTHILLFGRDVILQWTRGSILNQDGFIVDPVTTLAELKACLTARHYAVLVLCHSLPAADRDTGIALAASLLPQVRLLALESYATTAFFPPLVQVSHTRTGPEGLRSAVQALVNTPESPNRLTKRKVTMTEFQGVVKWFNNAKGYGFLGRNDGAPDGVTPHRSIEGDGREPLTEVQTGLPADRVKVLQKK